MRPSRTIWCGWSARTPATGWWSWPRHGAEHAIAFDEPAYALSLSPGYEYDTTVTRFVYQSPTTPRQWFDYDMASRERTLRKTQEVPSGHDPARYETRRLYADGARTAPRFRSPC